MTKCFVALLSNRDSAGSGCAMRHNGLYPTAVCTPSEGLSRVGKQWCGEPVNTLFLRLFAVVVLLVFE